MHLVSVCFQMCVNIYACSHYAGRHRPSCFALIEMITVREPKCCVFGKLGRQIFFLLFRSLHADFALQNLQNITCGRGTSSQGIQRLQKDTVKEQLKGK